MTIGLWHFGRKGGGARYTLELARELSTSKNLSFSLLISYAVDLKQEYDLLPCKKYYFKTITRHFVATKKSFSNFILPIIFILRFPVYLFRFYFAIRKLDYVICTMAHPLNIFFSWLFYFLDTKYILVIHEPNSSRSIYKRLTLFLIRSEVMLASGLVFLSNSSKNIFISENPYYSKPTCVIPHGVFRYSSQISRNFDNMNPRLLFFGRIDQYKGLDLLIETYRYLKNSIPGVSLSIIGSGDLPTFLTNSIAPEGVTIINRWIPEEDVAKIFFEHDICILPYTNSTQSGVVPIASWVGVPVVCTPVGGLKEQVINGINGFISEDMSAYSMAIAINKLLNPYVYNSISSKAKLFSAGNWNWKLVLESFINFSKKL